MRRAICAGALLFAMTGCDGGGGRSDAGASDAGGTEDAGGTDDAGPPITECAEVLTAPANGTVDRTMGLVGEVATYSCESLYFVDGDRERTCQADGTWSGIESRCSATGGYPLWPIPGTAPHPFDYDIRTLTVIDRVTGLEWERAVSPDLFTWEEATAYCADRELDGKTDWRLPSRIELESIVDYTTVDPAIDASVFPDTPAARFVTASLHVIADGDAWYVDFSEGTTEFGCCNGMTSSYRARCVR